MNQPATAPTDDPPPHSPFHAGERAIHARLSITEDIEQLGRRMIRDHLPPQQRKFYESLAYLIVAAADETGQPWVSALSGAPGFIRTPDDRTLDVRFHMVPGDPLRRHLLANRRVGLLGIDLATRRRNRANGTIQVTDESGVVLRVEQAFGNCPQYITPREIGARRSPPAGVSPGHQRRDRLLPPDADLIRRADTLFIASQHTGAAAYAGGMDVSHRGGPVGFVRVDDERTLTIPDYAGNQHFNTLGNLSLDPRAGLLFIDFTRGDLLHLTGTTQIVWAGDGIARFPNAERLVRFWVQHSVRVAGGWPWQMRGQMAGTTIITESGSPR